MRKNKKKIFSFITTLVICLNFSSVVTASVPAANNIKQEADQSGTIETAAKSAILMENSTGKILFHKNSHERMSLASITKVMTMLLAMEAIDSGRLKLTDTIVCSEHAASMGGSTICFGEGEHLTVNEVLKGIAVASGNDAAVAMAEKIGGTEDNFVNMMNKRAGELGMKDSHFVNACGLDEKDHYSSAYDIILMSRELIKHPLIFKYLTIWTDKLEYPYRKKVDQRVFNLNNTNKLIRFYSGANGIKTGSTEQAKFCLSASALRDGMQLLAVVMGCANNKERFKEASQILNYGFANYAIAPIIKKGTVVGKCKVEKGKPGQIAAATDRDLNILTPKGKKLDTKQQIHIGKLAAPVRKGQIVGNVEYFVDKKSVGKIRLVADQCSDKMNLRDNLMRVLDRFFNFK